MLKKNIDPIWISAFTIMLMFIIMLLFAIGVSKLSEKENTNVEYFENHSEIK